jgi:hypothetical protein
MAVLKRQALFISEQKKEFSIDIEVLSQVLVGDRILALVKEKDALQLIFFNKKLEIEDKIVTLNASNGFILDAWKGRCLLALDNQLIAFQDGELKPILKAKSSNNFFWHAIRVKDQLFLQEYGKSPTGIFTLTENYEKPRLLTINTDVDKNSKHFHSLTYDPFRDWLISTLGDMNLVRAVASEDHGVSWHTIYRGPWQFVPIVPLEEKIVFGMDSGIAKGGIGIFNPNKNSWNFIFLKCPSKDFKFLQMCDLKHLDNGLWVAAFGMPRAVAISKDLKSWYTLCLDVYDGRFCYNMVVNEGKENVVCSTGKRLILLEKSALPNYLCGNAPFLTSYDANFIRAVGSGFVLKRKLKLRSRLAS